MKINKSAWVHVGIVGLVGSTAAIAGMRGASQPAFEMDKMQDPAFMEEAMAKWMQASQPGPAHEWLAQGVGEWTVETKMFWDPSGPPTVTKGTATMELILGGKFLMQKLSSEMPMPGPDGVQMVPFEGMGIMGFDNVKKQFTMVWMDSMGTATYTSRGSLSFDQSTLTMFGEMDEPMTGEMGKTVRYQSTSIDENTTRFTIAEVIYGEPMVMMDSTYTRVK